MSWLLPSNHDPLPVQCLSVQSLRISQLQPPYLVHGFSTVRELRHRHQTRHLCELFLCTICFQARGKFVVLRHDLYGRENLNNLLRLTCIGLLTGFNGWLGSQNFKCCNVLITRDAYESDLIWTEV